MFVRKTRKKREYKKRYTPEDAGERYALHHLHQHEKI